MKILVTGSAGFIGFHTSKKFLEKGHTVIGVDFLNDYYDPILKEKRNEILSKNQNYSFHKIDISDYESLHKLCEKDVPDMIVHLAAQAGVRYSLQNPWSYERSNILGTINIFEIAKKNKIKRVILASSSSVYGSNTKIPFSEDDNTDSPISLYAASKKSCEVIAKSYNHLYGISVACLRFFTVYGEYGRPDMALFSFSKDILSGKTIKLFNHGKMKRDFTYVEDIVEGIYASALKENLQYEIYNLGCDNPIELEYIVNLLEKNLNKEVKKEYLDMQLGDVLNTGADISKAKRELNFEPKVKIEEGISRFAKWFLENKEWLLSLKDVK